MLKKPKQIKHKTNQEKPQTQNPVKKTQKT